MPNILGLLNKDEKAFCDKGKNVSIIRSSYPPKVDSISVIFVDSGKVRFLDYMHVVVGDIIVDNENRQRFNVTEILPGEHMEPIRIEEKGSTIEKKIASKVASIMRINF